MPLSASSLPFNSLTGYNERVVLTRHSALGTQHYFPLFFRRWNSASSAASRSSVVARWGGDSDALGGGAAGLGAGVAAGAFAVGAEADGGASVFFCAVAGAVFLPGAVRSFNPTRIV